MLHAPHAQHSQKHSGRTKIHPKKIKSIAGLKNG
jgi:hypothetical protein